MDESDNRFLAEAGISRIYLRLFDIGFSENGSIAPVAPVRIYTDGGGREIIPVVFIANDVWSAAREDLPAKVTAKAKALLRNPRDGRPLSIHEIQIDSDWSVGTKDRYFHFLEGLRREASFRRISATIRLHQIQFSDRTGIPPVDRGMLMMYSTGDPRKYEVTNSILDLRDASAYLKNLKEYPLPLDEALPLFNWGVVFHARHFRRLIHDLDESELASSDFQKSSGNRYRALRRTKLSDVEILAGEEIRFEKTDPELAEKARQIFRTQRDSFSIALFHWHAGWRKYDPEQINSLFSNH